ncbi:RsmD family RNA methyltransferase [Ascidiimonas sp. W6]|uniref:RsmD family RNA methyltransferase n=1 Tax=Ascidiimonas meishanensis TaxID=3128903 RepID=UPI0030EDCA73
MRIISGKHKGRRLMAPGKLPVRPTTDFAKEALFNILNNYYHFEEISVLDLFSGTGNISFEFASRGCLEVVSVDSHHGCIKYIEKIAIELSLEIKTIKSDVFKFLENTNVSRDVIFADPPYDLSIEQFEKIVYHVFNNSLLKEQGTLIIEHSKHTKLDHLPNFHMEKRYGGNVFSFFEIP